MTKARNSKSTKDKWTKNIYLSVFICWDDKENYNAFMDCKTNLADFLNFSALAYAYYLLREKIDSALLALSPLRLPLSFTETPNCGLKKRGTGGLFYLYLRTFHLDT